MTHRVCSEQPDILIASAEGRGLPDALEAHLRACPSCREQAAAIAFVRGLADTPDARHQLPDPAVIWWKAQLLRRWQAERAASAPIERMRWVELAAGVASVAILLVWQWRSLADFAARVIPAGIAASTAVPQAAHPLTLALLVATMASAGALILAALHRRLGGTA